MSAGCLLCSNREHMVLHDELWSHHPTADRPVRDDVNFWCTFLTGVELGARAGAKQPVVDAIMGAMCAEHRALASRAFDEARAVAQS